jgi:putative iron-dependent peroxidase
VTEQQQAMGRTKPDSVELEDKPATAHIDRTDQDELGKIFRRNMPYGSVGDHGTIFVGLSGDQHRLHRMLERMAGRDGEPRDALTRYTTPLTGSYYFIPAVQSLRAQQVVSEPGGAVQASS